ncbi:MAG: T9SS type A sorting domain-containing protein [Fibrobacter sp.]|nr:T9SS type A sorting domain-containing protein [Fibrobacter sp.]
MNKKIISASAAVLAAASMSFGFETWYGNESVYQINTELDVGTETAGYWFDYNDANDGGASSVTWPVEKGNPYAEDALDPIIDYCGGVCGTAVLGKGTLTYNPFVGIGFNIGGEDESGTPAAVDATGMGGICITYTTDAAPSIELGLGDAEDDAIGYDNPAASGPKAASNATTKEFAWSAFKQAGWGKGKITGEEAAAKLVSIKFKIQAAPGSYQFNIQSIGAYGGGCRETGSAIGASAAQSSLKAQLSGRTLSFGKTVASAEIVNLQGQVVMTASSVKSMDLSKVQSGVYMVRAAGLSQKIILK